MSLLYKIAVPVVTSGAIITVQSLLGCCSTTSAFFIFAILAGGSLFREFVGFAKYSGKEKLNGKTVIVTGANTGIGKETVIDLARRGARIIMACRDIQRCESAKRDVVYATSNTNIVCKRLDLSSMQSIRDFCEDFNQTESRLDILINNAGVMMTPKQYTKDGLDMQMGTNHFGHFLLTKLLLDKLKASAPSRIVILSSTGHRITTGLDFNDINCDKDYDPYKTYGCSKLANIYHAQELAKRLEGTGVTTYAVHPGVVNTELPRHFAITTNPIGAFLLEPVKYYFLKTPFEGAQTTLACALDPALAMASGRYYADCREDYPKPLAYNDAAAKKLWEVSEELTKAIKAD